MILAMRFKLRTTQGPALLIVSACMWEASGQPSSAGAAAGVQNHRLLGIVNAAVQSTLQQFAARKLESNQIAVTLVDLRDRTKPVRASFRGDVPIYPASVVKLFYLAAAHRWMEDGKLPETAEMGRAMRDMIVDSGNDPTSYIVDALTGTTSGPELPTPEVESWTFKRNAINRYFSSLSYTGINVNQKPWGDGPYGRERIFVGTNYGNRNQLTTEATARLLTEMVQGRAVSLARSAAMLKLLERDPFKKTEEPDQANDFTGLALSPGAKLWSKAGWTSTTRHDAAYVELPGGEKFVLVTFTTSHSQEREIIPTVAKAVISSLGNAK